MASTAQTIIFGAIRAASLKGRGYTIEAEEAQDGLEVLNQMLRAWQNDDLFVPYRSEQNHALTVSQASYTWGSGGDLDDTRPLDIHAAWLRDSANTDYPLKSMTVEEYARISVKDSNGRPRRYYFEPRDPLAQIVFEMPLAETDTLYARVLLPLTTFTALTTEDSVPDEYIEPIKYNLALRLAPEYGGQVSQDVRDLAKDGLKMIKRRNNRFRVPIAELDPALQQYGAGASYGGINQG